MSRFLFYFQDSVHCGCSIAALQHCSIAALQHCFVNDRYERPKIEDKTRRFIKMASSSKTVMAVEACSEGEQVVVLGAAGKYIGGKNWPHMKFLCTKHKEVLFKIFRAVDECKCTKELSANNSDYPKGNGWNQLYDHFFGGGTAGRGLLAGHRSSFPTMTSASKLKMKILDIWAYLKKESTQDLIKVDMNLVQIALRQEMEYEEAKAQDKAAADKQKQTDVALQEQMQTYEAGLGSLPPGAKGNVGGGCRQHSTNLKTNQPAAYGYANFTTGPDRDDKTPPRKKAKTSAAVVHGNGLAQLEKLGESLDKTLNKLIGGAEDGKVNAAGERKRKQDALQEVILFYQNFPENEKTKKALEDAMAKHLALTTELLDE
jgi:hypothetical protein